MNTIFKISRYFIKYAYYYTNTEMSELEKLVKNGAIICLKNS